MSSKLSRRLSLLSSGLEPLNTGSPCSDCGVPRTALNTSVGWSDAARTRLTFQSAACDPCRSARICKRLREECTLRFVGPGEGLFFFPLDTG